MKRTIVLSLLVTIVIAGEMMPVSCNQGLSHQPSTINQMKMLVTPDNPAVTQTLNEILSQPLPEITTMPDVYKSFLGYSQDFNRIVDWVGSNVSDVSDKSVHGVSDYWQLPSETLSLGTGDCEDYAILLTSLLRAYGVPADDVYVAIGKTSTDEDHAWVVEKFYKGVWRVIDRADVFISGSLSDSYETRRCFNDKNGFNGNASLPAGEYGFELSDSFYPIVSMPGISDSTLAKGIASTTYYRELKAGQTVSATLEWLPDSTYSTYNSSIVYPWSIYVYDQKGNSVFSSTDTVVTKTVDFTIKTTGTYEIEVLKRDALPRCAVLKLDPVDWKIQETSSLFHLPNTEIINVPTPTIPAQTNNTTAAAGVPQLQMDKLAQSMLDLINKDRAAANVAAVILGNNNLAQAHADDMLNNLFLSQYGTDGSRSTLRYTLGGGTSYENENEYMSKISWQGGTEAAFENAVLSALEQAESGLMSQTSTLLPPEGASNIVNKWNQKVSLGIAYNSDYLFLVQQFEGVSVTFTQPPAIQNGILGFSIQNIFGVVGGTASVSYDRTPYNLTPAQLNNAQWEGPRTAGALIWQPSPSSIMTTPLSGYQYIDPLTVPFDAPVSSFGSMNTVVPIPVTFLSLNFTASTWETGGSSFSASADLSQMISRLGAGIYTVRMSVKSSILGTNSSEVHPLFVYSIIVK
jgi:predicted transglutaminase-like cysteine proteinase